MDVEETWPGSHHTSGQSWDLGIMALTPGAFSLQTQFPVLRGRRPVTSRCAVLPQCEEASRPTLYWWPLITSFVFWAFAYDVPSAWNTFPVFAWLTPALPKSLRFMTVCTEHLAYPGTPPPRWPAAAAMHTFLFSRGARIPLASEPPCGLFLCLELT